MSNGQLVQATQVLSRRESRAVISQPTDSLGFLVIWLTRATVLPDGGATHVLLS